MFREMEPRLRKTSHSKPAWQTSSEPPSPSMPIQLAQVYSWSCVGAWTSGTTQSPWTHLNEVPAGAYTTPPDQLNAVLGPSVASRFRGPCLLSLLTRNVGWM